MNATAIMKNIVDRISQKKEYAENQQKLNTCIAKLDFEVNIFLKKKLARTYLKVY